MACILGRGVRSVISNYFHSSNHVATFPKLWREIIKMDKTTQAEISAEPPTKKQKIMPSETTNGTHSCKNETEFDSRTLVFHKLSENAYTPTRGSDHAVGFDLYSAYDMVIKAQDKDCVKTDIQIMLPEGCYGRVAPRSGLAAKKHIDVGAGVIDRDYRGPVGVVLFNHAQTDFEVKKGDRVAQLICERAYIPELIESGKPLPETTRGAGGFGSTGGFQEKSETNGADKENGKMETNGVDKKETNGADKENGKKEKKGEVTKVTEKTEEMKNGAEPMDDKPSEEVKA